MEGNTKNKEKNYDVFTGNEIGIEGARLLSEVLKANTVLASLYLFCEGEESNIIKRSK